MDEFERLLTIIKSMDNVYLEFQNKKMETKQAQAKAKKNGR
jgi:hypothetical protein